MSSLKAKKNKKDRHREERRLLNEQFRNQMEQHLLRMEELDRQERMERVRQEFERSGIKPLRKGLRTE